MPTPITLETLTALTDGLGPSDYHEFAGRVADIDPALGETVRLHAEAADGNSPDLRDWPRHTMTDRREMDGIETVDQAREWWTRRYAP